jgi:hypothetical protein
VGAGIVAAVMLSYSSVQWLSAFTPSQKVQHQGPQVGASGSSFSGRTFASENMEAALNVADMFT